MTYPLRRISIRVPWHDTGWNGRVCAAPRLNSSCLRLKRIAEGRDDAAEEAVAGKRLDELPQEKWPARTPLHALPSRSIWMIASKSPGPRATANAGVM